MAESITIFDPKEKPFGWLSNNYKHTMKLDDKLWQTVTNYIYANMLSNPMHIEEVRKIFKTKDVKPRFDLLYTEEINDITKKSIGMVQSFQGQRGTKYTNPESSAIKIPPNA